MFNTLAVKNFKTAMAISVVAGALAVIMTVQPVSAADPDSAPTTKYHFDLTKGQGTPVCEAYLKRLNTADYKTPPYCDRPEETKVPGFTPLRRVALTPAETVYMQFHIRDFMLGQRQRPGDQYPEQMRQGYPSLQKAAGSSIDKLFALATKDMEGFMQRGELIAWRYDPPVDIDNDGKPDRVLVWQGGS